MRLRRQFMNSKKALEPRLRRIRAACFLSTLMYRRWTLNPYRRRTYSANLETASYEVLVANHCSYIVATIELAVGGFDLTVWVSRAREAIVRRENVRLGMEHPPRSP